MAVWNPSCSAKELDLGLELGSTGVGEVSAERLRGERVGALGRVVRELWMVILEEIGEESGEGILGIVGHG